MKVSYVTTGHENIASYRYRIQAPVMALASYGIEGIVDRKADKEAPVVVFSKHWTHNDWSYAEFCRLRGQRVVFDICDDHFEREGTKEHYFRMCDVAHVITVNSEAMRILVQEKTGRDSIVIHDPVLSPKRVYQPGKPLLMVWYGQVMNLKGLFEVYSEGCMYPLEIVVAGAVDPPEHFKAAHVQWTQWHKDVIPQVAQRASMALLPYRQDKQAKSANRVLEALWNGLPVATDLIPSVAQLGLNGIFDLSRGLEACVQKIDGQDLSTEMRSMQDQIEKWYSPKAVAKDWDIVFRGLA